MNNTEKDRYNFIDIARGLALFLVVAGHLFQFNSKPFNWIFSFHMPLFFILSGFCFDIKPHTSFTKYLIRKIKTLLIPYFAFLGLGFLISYLVNIWRVNALSTQAFRLAFYYTQPEYFHVGQIWFLIALFISSIMLYFLDNIFIKPQCTNFKKNIACIVLIVIFSYIGYSINRVVNVPTYGRLPWKIDVSFMAVSFMIFGTMLHRFDIFNYLKRKKTLSIFLAIFFLYLNYHFGLIKNGYVNICDCFYGNSIFNYYISAISGSLVIILISNLISKNLILEYYGKNSLFMFAVHSFLLVQSQYFLSKIYKTNYIIMNNIPIKQCIMAAIVIIIFLAPLTLVYNYLKRLLNFGIRKEQSR